MWTIWRLLLALLELLSDSQSQNQRSAGQCALSCGCCWKNTSHASSAHKKPNNIPHPSRLGRGWYWTPYCCYDVRCRYSTYHQSRQLPLKCHRETKFFGKMKKEPRPFVDSLANQRVSQLVVLLIIIISSKLLSIVVVVLFLIFVSLIFSFKFCRH